MGNAAKAVGTFAKAVGGAIKQVKPYQWAEFWGGVATVVVGASSAIASIMLKK